MQEFIDALVAFVRANEEWAAPIAFLVAFAESFCFLSLLWPGTAILIGISALLAASGVGTWVLLPAILAAAAGGTLGYAASYWIGLYFKDSIHKIWPFSRRPNLIPAGQTFFEKHGAFGVFLGHFFGPVRAVIPVVAGMFNMPQIPFQIANVLSASIWSVGVIAPAFLLVAFKTYVLGFMSEHEVLIALVLLLLAFANAAPSAFLYWPSLILFAGVGVLQLIAASDQFLVLWLAGATGAFLGDLAFYYVGRSHREAAFVAWFMNGDSKALARANTALDTKGAWTVVTSKAVGPARAFVPLAAGVRALPYAQFLPASALAAIVWAGVLLSLRFILYLFGV
jgi:membrane protein DedA with SNARE-associated domain